MLQGNAISAAEDSEFCMVMRVVALILATARLHTGFQRIYERRWEAGTTLPMLQEYQLHSLPCRAGMEWEGRVKTVACRVYV